MLRLERMQVSVKKLISLLERNEHGGFSDISCIEVSDKRFAVYVSEHGNSFFVDVSGDTIEIRNDQPVPESLGGIGTLELINMWNSYATFHRFYMTLSDDEKGWVVTCACDIPFDNGLNVEDLFETLRRLDNTRKNYDVGEYAEGL